MRQPAFLLASALGLWAASPADAAEMYPWRAHAAPFSFLFGNEIDTHQQSRPEPGGGLRGWFYVRHTGVVTSDGYPVATHADCNAVADCFVGWTFEAEPGRAALVRQPMHDHPLFLMPRAAIPQPGAYSHFHWTGMAMPMPYATVPGYVMALTAVNRFCFIHHMADAAMSAMSCRDNGGVKIERGIDNATHLNIVTSDPSGM